MITEKVKSLFLFVDYLHSNIEKFERYKPLVAELQELNIKRNKLRPNENFRDRIDYERIQGLQNPKFDLLMLEVITPIKIKADDLNICNPNDAVFASIYNWNISSIYDLIHNFEINDIEEIIDCRNKYYEYKLRMDCDFYLNQFFSRLEEVLSVLFDYFKENKNEISINNIATVDNLEDLLQLQENGINVRQKISTDIFLSNKKNVQTSYVETLEIIENDFNEEYRKFTINLLRQFENDSEFMGALRLQFSQADLKPLVNKYWRLFYSSEVIGRGFEENDKLIPLHSGKGDAMASFVSETEFVKHLKALRSQFYGLKQMPKCSYVHDIQKTNIYIQFKEIQTLLDDFQKIDNWKDRTDNLKEYAESYAIAILREIDKIEYEPIREPLIKLMIEDSENVYLTIKGIGTTLQEQKIIKEQQAQYRNAKLYLDNYLFGQDSKNGNSSGNYVQEPLSKNKSDIYLKVEAAFNFMSMTDPRKHKIILDNGDFDNLINWVAYYFENNFTAPDISNPIKIVNTNKGNVIYTFMKLFKDLHPTKTRPESLFVLIKSIFYQYRKDNISNMKKQNEPIYYKELDSKNN